MCRMNSGIIEALLLIQSETSMCLSIDTVDLIQAAKSDSWDTFFIGYPHRPSGLASRYQPFFNGFNLHGHIARIDSAVSKAAAYKP